MKWYAKLYTRLIFIFLYLPIIVLIIFSFNESKSRAHWVAFPSIGIRNCSTMS